MLLLVFWGVKSRIIMIFHIFSAMLMLLFLSMSSCWPTCKDSDYSLSCMHFFSLLSFRFFALMKIVIPLSMCVTHHVLATAYILLFINRVNGILNPAENWLFIHGYITILFLFCFLLNFKLLLTNLIYSLLPLRPPCHDMTREYDP